MNFRLILALLSLAASQHPATGAKTAELDTTVFGALKLLPKDIAKRVARIEAREGNPWPSRWYILVHDPSEPRGLREYVFTEGRQVAARTLSQFADTLSASDVFGADAIKVNSDTAAGIAGQFALHNGVRLGSVNYELHKTGTPSVTSWRLTCLDPAGDQLGTILIHAGKGTVTSFDGFEKAPFAVTPAVAKQAKPAGVPAPQKPETIPAKPAQPKSTSPAPVAKPQDPADPVKKPFFEKPAPKPGPIDRIGNSIRKTLGREPR